MITLKRGKNGNYLLMDGDKQVGEAWKIKGKLGFGVRLYGFYWKNNEPCTRGGLGATRIPRLKDAVPLTESVLMQREQ